MYPSFVHDALGAGALTAYVENRVFATRYFQRFFPFRKLPSLTFNVLTGVHKNILAEVVAYGSPAPEKKRRTVSKLSGDVPAIRIKRRMSESDLNQLLMYLGMAFPDAAALADLLFGDVDFCVESCLNRLEYLGLRALSQGEITLDSDNSGGVITTDVIDFQIPSDQKEVVSAADQYWTAGAKATNDPIGDIEDIQSAGRADGVIYQYAVMSAATFAAARQSQSVINYVFGRENTSPSKKPTLEDVNRELTADGLPRIIVIDSAFDLEDKNGDISSVTAWPDSYVSFLPQVEVGKTYAGPLASEAVKTENELAVTSGNVRVRKWSDHDPVTEFTLGEVNAFPVITDTRIRMLYVEGHTTWPL